MGNTGVVNTNIEPTVVLDAGADESFHLFVAADVAAHGRGFTALGFNFIGNGLHGLGVNITEGEFGASLREALGSEFSKTAGGSGDKHYLITKIVARMHRLSPRLA